MPILIIIDITAANHIIRCSNCIYNDFWSIGAVFKPCALSNSRSGKQGAMPLKNSINIVFPTCVNLLFRWDINNCFLHTAGMLPNEWGMWQILHPLEPSDFFSDKKYESDGNLQSLKKKFSLNVISVNENWIPCIVMFVSCLINNHLHFEALVWVA